MGTLFIVATPLGNLSDITLRAIETLKTVDLVLAEDTRVTAKLLGHYNIKKPLVRYDEHVAVKIHAEILEKLAQGRSVALVTDAGTPGISDPGARLVSYVVSHSSNTKIVPIPGPSAFVAALSAAGLDADQFTFLGYPPHKKGRERFFRELTEIKNRPIVFYESTHRLGKALKSLEAVLGAEGEIIVAKELTKIHEEFFRGTTKNAESYFSGAKTKGEFVIIVP